MPGFVSWHEWTLCYAARYVVVDVTLCSGRIVTGVEPHPVPTQPHPTPTQGPVVTVQGPVPSQCPLPTPKQSLSLRGYRSLFLCGSLIA